MVDKAKIEQAVRLLLTGLPACVKKFTEVLVMKRISIC